MKPRLQALTLALTLMGSVFLSTAAPAQTYDSRQQQELRLGNTVDSITVQGALRGFETQQFRIPAERGQIMSIVLQSRDRYVAFQVLNPRNGAIVHDGLRNGRTFRQTLPNSGDWIVEVFFDPYYAQPGDQASFSLVAGFEQPATVRPPTPPNPPAALPPLVVNGVGRGDSLNIRSEPNLNGRVVATARNGTVLVNGGCFAQSATTWCAVSDPQGRFAGFASARYLVEQRNAGYPPTQPKPPVKPTQPVLNFNAMKSACRTLAHDTWNIPPGFIVAQTPVQVRNGYQSNVDTLLLNIKGTCTFDSKGNLLSFR